MIGFKRGSSDREENDHDDDKKSASSTGTMAKNAGNASVVTPPPQLSSKYGIGAKLLMQMGYIPGTGLGLDGAGIVKPIETEARDKGVGIGMLSSVRGTEYDDDSYGSSSDDERDVSERSASTRLIGKPVLFSNDVKILKSSKEEELDLVRQRLRDLKFEFDEKDINADNLTKLKILVFKLTKQMNDNLSKETRRNVLEKSLDSKIQQLKFVDSLIVFFENDETKADENTNMISLIEKLLEISSFTDVDKDSFISQIVGHYFKDQTITVDFLIQEDNAFLTKVNQLLELISYYPSFQNFVQQDGGLELSTLQTAIYSIIYPTLEDFFASNVETTKLSMIITLLLDYEEILSFINVYDYLIAQFLVPNLVEIIESCELHESGSILRFFKDFDVILSENVSNMLKDTVKVKFKSHLTDWYHRSPDQIPREIISLIKENVYKDDTAFFKDIEDCGFLNKFIEQLWEKYFDLEQDLVEQETKFISYFMETLYRCELLFSEKDFITILFHCFNSIEKALFQWVHFKPETFSSDGIRWFEWVTSLFPSDNEYCNTQIGLINEWLKSGSKDVIHDERASIYDDLLTKHDCATDRVQPVWTMGNIPLEKISYSFKDIVDEYCEKNGLMVVKDESNDLVSVKGKPNREVHPLYTIKAIDPHISKKKVKVFIKSNVLWVQQDNNTAQEFSPMALETLLEKLT